MARRGRHCWNKSYNVTTLSCDHHPQGQRKEGEERHADEVLVRPGDRETSVSWQLVIVIMWSRRVPLLLLHSHPNYDAKMITWTLCLRSLPGKKEGEKHADGVPVCPEDKETSVAWQLSIAMIYDMV